MVHGFVTPLPQVGLYSVNVDRPHAMFTSNLSRGSTTMCANATLHNDSLWKERTGSVFPYPGGRGADTTSIQRQSGGSYPPTRHSCMPCTNLHMG